MSMPPKKTKTIEELRRELEQKESRLDELKAKRDELDREIAELEGRPAPARRKSKKKAGRKAGKKARSAGGRRGRGKGGKPLLDYIKEVLAGKPEGMRVKEIEEAVTQAGYRSKSKDFYGIIATTVRDPKHFERLDRGVYRLKGEGGKKSEAGKKAAAQNKQSK
jgi:hypothetical protein